MILISKSPALRRVAGRCRPDRRCSSFAKRSGTSGRRRARKQLRQCPDAVSTSKQTDSDVADDIERRRDDTQAPQQHNDIECTQPINERLTFPNELNSKRLDNRFRFSTNKDLKAVKHSTSYCSNCGDYVSGISFPNSFRSLPNYSANYSDNHSIDPSTENSSGPISFDSGIEQPYKDTRTTNSSPVASLLYCSESKTNRSARVQENVPEKSINLPVRQTKTAETQTDWVPLRVVVIERDHIIPAKSIFELKHRNLKSDSSNKLLRVTRRTKDRKSWLKNSSTSSTNIEDEHDRVYHSDSAINTDSSMMPVGTSFENSAMKSSFSLSSLQGTASGGSKGSPLRAPANQERPYHSLTKKRKDSSRELWRRSWGSTYSNQSIQSLSSATLAAKDDFWAALQQNYNYIMDNQLIDSCKEANGELNAETTPPISLTLPKDLPSSSSQWNIGQLIADFTELCQWLTNIQEEVYASPENLANRTLRAKRMSELKACDNRRRRFMEQCAGALARGGVIEHAEVTWRARHLALKWDSVLQVMSPEHANSNQIISDAEHEVKCLRRWLREMEARLPPLCLTAASAWSKLQLDQKVKEHEVLQREVEWHGRIVSSVVRLCRLGPAEAVAKGLERRWHHLYLRALEWQCHLESCVSRKDAESLIEPSQLTDSDEEPVIKHPRLSGPDDANEKSSLVFAKQIAGNLSTDESEDDNDDLVDDYYNTISPGSEADTEGSIPDDERDVIMASLPHVDENIIENLLANMPILDDIGKPADAVPSTNGQDQIVVNDLNELDCVDGIDTTLEASLYEDQQTPCTVVKRPKKVNDSKFRSTNRKSKNLGVYYFKHPDTESDTQLISGTDDKSQEDTSEEEWTYTACERENSADNTDVMTSSVENPEELRESDATVQTSAKMKLNFDSCPETPEKSDIPKPLKLAKPTPAPENIIRLVNQADEMVQKKAQEMNSVPIELAKSVPKKSKLVRNLKPLNLNGSPKDVHNHAKMSRIKEWLQQNTPDDESELSQQVLDSCDASGEYTTGDSDHHSVTSEELSPSVATYCNMNSSQEHSINIATPTNQGPPKVTLRGKRNSCTQNIRPWSVSCLSQLNYGNKGTSTSAMNTPTNDKIDTVAAYGRSSGMSISESALHTLATTPNMRRHGKDKFQGSTSSVKTAIQAHLSSSTTLNEGCVTCNENLNDKKCSLRRKRQKLRRRHQDIISNELEIAELRLAQIAAATVGNRLVKSCSFSGKSSMKDYKQDRCSSDPSSSRNKHRLDTSTSDNDSEEENTAPLQSHLGQSTDHTIHASASEDQNIDGSVDPIPDVAPKFKLGPEGGLVRPRLPFLNIERERSSLLGLPIVERSVLAELASADRDSDVDRSVQTAGTEEHSSFSEQAWDYFCQEKYQSEAYSEEAPDSDAARKLLDFGDDYRMFLDSQSDACSSLSAHPDASPLMNRRKYPMQNYSPTGTENRKLTNRSALDSPENGSFGRRSKKSSTSSFDRKKSLMNSLERSRSNNGEESDRIRKAKKILSDSLERKRLQVSDLDYSSDRKKHTSTSSEMYNSSLEYQSANQLNGNKPDIIDSLNRRNRKTSSESNSRQSDDSNPHQADASLNSSMESPSRRKRLSHDCSDANNKNASSVRRRGSNGASLLQMERRGFDSDSDTDDIKHLLARSSSQLDDAESVIAKEDVTPDLLQINDYSDLLATCNENIRCLEAMLVGASEGVLSSAQQREITGLITRWSTVRTAGETRLTARRLHREILSLKGSLLGPKNEEKPALHSRSEIHHRVEDLRARLSTLNGLNNTMVKLNASVHRLMNEIKSNTSGNCISDTLCNNLNGEVTDLYVLWNESFESANTELQTLESALEAWKSWELGMAELRGALREDCDTVRLIETALATGDPAKVAPHVTKLATLLSEANNQKGECGSFSDSGLSDSGGEQELSERERRLAELRSSARAMEAVLAPGSKLLKGITRKMEQAELELRTLQTTCRELIVRTAVGVANAGGTQVEKSSWDVASRLSMSSSARKSSISENSLTAPDDPDSDPIKSVSPLNGRSKRWAWCALPLQICLLALLCACLMGGPRCCDAVNNLSTGFTPQLRYTRGPPPM